MGGSLRVEAWGERPIAEFRRTFVQGMGLPLGDEADARLDRLLDRSLTFGAFEGGELVGTVGAYRFGLTVPGGEVDAVGTTLVAVLPTHRRRGVLRAMLSAHLDAARDAGCSVAGLWASETPIYGRFGFGVAADRGAVSIDAKRCLPFAPPSTGRVVLCARAEAEPEMRAIYDRHRGERAGLLSRTATWWAERRLADDPWLRAGFGPHQFALFRRGADATGYLHFRRRSEWTDGLPRDTLEVLELMGDAEARRALWCFALSIDLVERVEAFSLPPDDVVPWLVADRRRVRITPQDALWVRLLDLPGALSARRYDHPHPVVLEVLPPEPSAPLRVGLDCATTPETWQVTAEPPDAQVLLADLGSMLFGGVSAHTLGAEGRLSAPPEVRTRLDAIFRTSSSPWCPERF